MYKAEVYCHSRDVGELERRGRLLSTYGYVHAAPPLLSVSLKSPLNTSTSCYSLRWSDLVDLLGSRTRIHSIDISYHLSLG